MDEMTPTVEAVDEKCKAWTTSGGLIARGAGLIRQTYREGYKQALIDAVTYLRGEFCDGLAPATLEVWADALQKSMANCEGDDGVVRHVRKVGDDRTAQTHARIRSAQIEAGEDAVIANLRSMGLMV